MKRKRENEHQNTANEPQHTALDRLVAMTGGTTYAALWNHLSKQIATEGVKDLGKTLEQAHTSQNTTTAVYSSLCLVSNRGLQPETLALWVGHLSKYLEGPTESFLVRNPDNKHIKVAMEAVIGVTCCLVIASVAVDGWKKAVPEALTPSTVMLHTTLQDEKMQSLLAALANALREQNTEAFYKVCVNVTEQGRSLFTSKSFSDVAKLTDILPMVNQTIAVKGSTDEKHSLARFTFKRQKTKGNAPGFEGEKKIKTGDDPAKEKYQHTWMVKSQSPVATIAEKLSADIFRYFIENSAPKVHLKANQLLDNTPLTASRFIKNFSDLSSIMSAAEMTLEQSQQYWLGLPGALDAVAVSAFLGNFDLNPGNLGIVQKEGAQEAAIVDFGCSLNLRAGFDSVTVKDNKYVVPGACKLEKGEYYQPVDMIRCLHRGNYRFNSPNFLNINFADALERVADMVEDNPAAFADMIARSAKEVQDMYREYPHKEWLNTVLGRIAPRTTLGNLEIKLCQALRERTPMMREFAHHLRIQVALMQNDHETLSRLLDQNLAVLGQPVKWLTENDREVIYPSLTIEKFAEVQGVSSECMQVIAAAKQRFEENYVASFFSEGAANEKDEPYTVTPPEEMFPTNFAGRVRASQEKVARYGQEVRTL